MDELGALILGEKPKASQTSVVTDQILDNLKKVESGGDRFALNKQSKAMGAYQFMPATVKMLNEQGIKFDPFNEQEARGAAKTYLEQLTQKYGGDVNKALTAYGGFKTKDPSAYIQNVMQGAQPSDPLEAFLSGKPATQALSAAGAGRGSYAGYNPEEAAAASAEATAETTETPAEQFFSEH